MAENRIPVAAVVGPTATGKTELGIGLCQRLGGEVVSCDSMQVYRGLPIGTAQPTLEELAAAPHHLIGFLDVNQPFSVSDYVEAAGKAIQGIRARGKFPVLVGGTGLYARSLLRGMPVLCCGVSPLRKMDGMRSCARSCSGRRKSRGRSSFTGACRSLTPRRRRKSIPTM